MIRVKNRDYKSFAEGEYYHLFNRGNAKMDIFRDESDFTFFLTRLTEYLYPDERRRAPSAAKERYVRKSFPANSFSLACYCLMPNHFHLALRQNGTVPISSLMLNLMSGYSRYFNKKYERVGSLFQDQFKAVHIDSNEYLLWLSAYIHQNPKVAGLVEQLEEYQFSSYPEYIGQSAEYICSKEIISGQFSGPDDYEKFVADSFESIKGRKDVKNLLTD
jgi:putative transposase